MLIPTPSYQLSGADRERVYDPSEDSFLLLDALQKDAALLRTRSPALCLEVPGTQVGCGSGVCGVFLSQLVGSCQLVSSDINASALSVTRRTSQLASLSHSSHLLQADLLTSIRGEVDVIIFNPPYVPSPPEEVTSSDLLLRALSGGKDGLQVIHRFLSQVSSRLCTGGLLYLVCVDANGPAQLVSSQPELEGTVICSRRAGIEHLHVIRYIKVELVQKAVLLGYDAVAINIDIDVSDEMQPGQKKKKKTSRLRQIPPPFSVPQKELDLSPLQQDGRRFRQYTRLTVGLSDPDFLHAMLKHPDVLKYDLLAVRPLSEPILSSLSGKPGVDIIALDPAEKYGWLVKSKVVGLVVERGLGLELAYAPALVDSSLRATLFAQGRQLIAAIGRKKDGLLLTSAASTPIQIRGPFDAANLLSLFGSRGERGRAALSSGPKRILLRAETKATARGAVHTAPLAGLDKSQLARLASVPEFRVQIEVLADKQEKAVLKAELSDQRPKAKKPRFDSTTNSYVPS